jgi:hypothetical protein
VRLAYPRLAVGWDVVFVVRAPAAEAPFPALTAAVEDLLRRAGLWTTLDNDGSSSSDTTSDAPGTHPPVPEYLTSDSA